MEKSNTYFLYTGVLSFLLYAIPGPLQAQVYDTTNYHDSSNWAAHPMKGPADMNFFPDYTIVEQDTVTKTYVHVDYDTTSSIDIFCIYPTTFPHDPALDSTQAQNYPIGPLEKIAARWALRYEYSQYVQFGRIYAPFYRQANLIALGLPHIPQSSREKQAAILDTAVTDLLGAYDYYIKHDNHGKRVILLGHSQGGIMLAMMLRKMESDPVKFQEHLARIFLAIPVGMECGPYVAKGSLIGGWWQTIPICQDPLDTACVMSWGTHEYGAAFSSIQQYNHIAENDVLVSKNYLYSTIDTTIHDVKMDPLSFIPSHIVDCSIYSKHDFTNDYGVTTDYIGYTNMYMGSISNPDAANYGLMIEPLSMPDDYRYDPLDAANGSDYHNWDMDVSVCDILDLIWQKINQTTTSFPENDVTEEVSVYPNPASDAININVSLNKANRSITAEIYSAKGELILKPKLFNGINSINTNSLKPGIYFLKVINDNSTVVRRLEII